MKKLKTSLRNARRRTLLRTIVPGLRRVSKSLLTPSCVTCVEADAQVKKLKSSLEDARRRMGAQSRTLQQHWRRGITMGDTVRLLSDINSIVDTPQRLQKLEEAKASPHREQQLTP